MNEENMERDSLELVLNDFTEQQKEVARQVSEQQKAITLLEERIASFDKKLEAMEVTSPLIDTGAIQTIISQGINEVRKMIGEQPKNVVQTKRFLLFPENNVREYYSVVLRWVLYMIIATYCYLLLTRIVNHLII